MNAKLTAAAVLFSSLLAGSAFADRHPAQPVYAPPAPTYVAPAPTYAAPVVTTVAYRDDDDRGAWQRFQYEQQQRAQSEERFLAQERANFTARWGWNGRKMAKFNRHQARERAQFQSEQAQREQQFRDRLAMNRRGHERHDRNWDYD